MSEKQIRIGIINVSDRASQGIYEDLPGKAIVQTLNEYLISAWQNEYAVIPDEQVLIEETLISMADEKKCCLIITSGGTGPALRDVTPEATEAVCSKMMPGFDRKFKICTHSHSFAANGWNPKSDFNCKFAGETKSHPSMFGCRVSGYSVLYRSFEWPLYGVQARSYKSLQAPIKKNYGKNKVLLRHRNL
jgi:molybdenum cofactor synthesis domain-containing protein